jgi:hypothetical protein
MKRVLSEKEREKIVLLEQDLLERNLIKRYHSGDVFVLDEMLSIYSEIILCEARDKKLKELDLDDRILEGKLVLEKCIRRFDLEKKSRFRVFFKMCFQRRLIDLYRSEQSEPGDVNESDLAFESETIESLMVIQSNQFESCHQSTIHGRIMRKVIKRLRTSAADEKKFKKLAHEIDPSLAISQYQLFETTNRNKNVIIVLAKMLLIATLKSEGNSIAEISERISLSPQTCVRSLKLLREFLTKKELRTTRSEENYQIAVDTDDIGGLFALVS